MSTSTLLLIVVLVAPIIILSISYFLLFVGGVYLKYSREKSILELRNGSGLEVFERSLKRRDTFRIAWLNFVSLATMVAMAAMLTFLLK